MMVNHRGMGVTHTDAACNSIIWEPTEPPTHPWDGISVNQAILAIAIQIRQLLIRLRDVNHLRALVAHQSALMKLPGYIERFENAILPDPGCMTANPLWLFDWTSAHFGYPNQTRTYSTNPTEPRYVKISTPNPTLLSDGKTWKSHQGDAEATFSLAEDVIERFKKILQDNASVLGMSGEVQFVE